MDSKIFIAAWVLTPIVGMLCGRSLNTILTILIVELLLFAPLVLWEDLF